MKAIIFLTFLLLSTVTNAATDASTHIQRMINQYAQLSEYEDKGTSIDIETTKIGDVTEEKITFKTKYKQNKEFKLTWVEYPDAFEKKLGMGVREYVFWRDDSGIYTKYHHDDKASVHNNIMSAISSVFGVFNESVIFVPKFLNANSSCKQNLGAASTSIVETTNNEVKIKLTTPGINDRYITINTNSYLLSKYEYEYTLSKDTKVKRVVKYNIIHAR